MRFKFIGLVFTLAAGLVLLNGLSTFRLQADDVNLVELQKKEKERLKKSKKKSQYTVTNDNLETIKVPEKAYGFSKSEKDETKKGKNAKSTKGKNGTKGAANSNTNKANTTVPQQSNSKGPTLVTNGAETSTPEETLTKEYWQRRKKKITDALAEAKKLQKQKESEIVSISGRILRESRMVEQGRLRDEIDKLKEEIKESLELVKKLEQDLENLYKEARRAKVPRGWL